MAIVVGNTCPYNGNGSTSSLAFTWSSNPAAGQKVLLVIQSGAVPTSVVDNGTTPRTFTLDAVLNSVGDYVIFVYRADNITLPSAGSYAVTVTVSGLHTISGAGVAISGALTGGPTATNTSGPVTSTSVTTGSVTPAAAGAFFIGGFTDQSALNPETITLTGAGFTSLWIQTNAASIGGGAGAYKLDTGGPTSTACTWTLGDSVVHNAAIAVYDAAASSQSASYARDPLAYAPGAPALTPTAVAVTNTPGNWLFAVATWRQDAGVAGTLQYPSTVSVSDDAHNFWIPVYSGQPAQAVSSSPVTGIMRTAVWMAPAARQAEFVFFSPTAYQSSLVAQVFEFPAASPWYLVEAVAETFTNQGTSVSQSLTVPNGVFAFGALAWDNNSLSVTPGAAGWTVLPSASATNGSDTAGDLTQRPFYLTGTGATQTLSASATTADWTATIVVVSGVSDARAYPYGRPALENWPVLVTEIGSGPVLNSDPVMAQGTAHYAGLGATVAAVTWPLWAPAQPYQPAQYGSLQVTPLSGNSESGLISADFEAVSPVTLYTALAFVYSVAGLSAESTYVGIRWYTSGLGFISETAGTAAQPAVGEWTELTLSPVLPPANAAFAKLVVAEASASSTISVSAVFFVGYAAFSAADSYEGQPPDQVAWTDISSRVFSQGSVGVSRGIQYEQQSLEAGTLTFYVANNDGAFTLGNVLSPYWPNVGDTDVPVRLRAVWPGSLTPYVVLFSGFTDAITYGVDPGTYYGYAEIQASDAWSRLTQQMLALVEQEALEDGPIAFISCSQNGANVISTGPFSTAAVQVLSTVNSTPLIIPPTASFSGGAITIPGASGLSCWQSGGTRTANIFGGIGYALVWTPNVTIQLNPGITVEFWYCPVSVFGTQAITNPIVCQALNSESTPLWQLNAVNANSITSYQNYFQITAFDSGGNSLGTTTIGTMITPYSTTAAAAANYYFVITFTQSAITVTINPGGLNGTQTESVTVTGLTLAPVCSGFTWGGGVTTTSGFGDTAIADIAIYDFVAPPARSAARYAAGLLAFSGESDNWRLARVAGYSGFVPVLGMRGTDLPAPPVADVDTVTGATDTNTQVVSAYFTNVTTSTLAVMFVDGPGTLVYRRRAEWYNRPVGQWVTGENDSQLLSLGINPLNGAASVGGWTTGNGAALVTGGTTAGGPLFNPVAGLFSGNGATANPFIITTSNPAVTPGGFYQFTVWLYSNQGWTTGGVNAQIQFFNASNAQVGSTQSSLTINIVAGSVAYATVGPVQAPAASAYLKAVVQVNGTPSSSVGFYVAAAQVSSVTPSYAPGAGMAVQEAPYQADLKISSDRAQLFNYAVLTQYGTNLVSSFTGTSVLFTPSSGVIVIVSNSPSITLRGQIPYTATIYINNTAQALPYELNEGSIEDAGSWITQTLGTPLFRPDTVTLTPAATPAALATALFAEVGDTVVFRRRPFGSPQVTIPTYISRITHSIDISSGQWTTQLDLSPYPPGTTLACDDVVHGVLSDQNILGW
jgi:hypothetical protein